MEAQGSPFAWAAQKASAIVPDAIMAKVMQVAGIDRLAALNIAIEAVSRGGTISPSSVFALHSGRPGHREFQVERRTAADAFAGGQDATEHAGVFGGAGESKARRPVGAGPVGGEEAIEQERERLRWQAGPRSVTVSAPRRRRASSPRSSPVGPVCRTALSTKLTRTGR
jgi:hypothetical protein